MRSLRDNGMYIGNNFPSEPSGVATLSALNRGFTWDAIKYYSTPEIIEIVDYMCKEPLLEEVRSLPYPSLMQEGDVLLLVRSSSYTPTITIPTPFTALLNASAHVDTPKVQIDYRIVDGTEGANFTLDHSLTAMSNQINMGTIIVVLRNADISKMTSYVISFVNFSLGLYLLVNQVTPQPYRGITLHFYGEEVFSYENKFPQAELDANGVTDHGRFTSKATGQKYGSSGTALRLFSRNYEGGISLPRIDLSDEVGNLATSEVSLTVLIGGAG